MLIDLNQPLKKIELKNQTLGPNPTKLTETNFKKHPQKKKKRKEKA